VSERDQWDRIRNLYTDADPGEQFIESSKLSPYDSFPAQEAIAMRMAELLESLPYDGYPATPLPAPAPVSGQLSDVLAARVSARAMRPQQLDLPQLAALLHHAYGITRTNEGTGFIRPFRSAPSGGGLYPLEIYFHSKHVNGLTPGLYHYNPFKNEVRRLREGDQTPLIADGFVHFQRNVAYDSSVIFFLTALFARSTFKYGTRAYRFILLEAGHVAQNMNLVATGLALGCLNIGGYYDRAMDRILGLDGCSQSTVYMVAVCKRIDDPPPAEGHPPRMMSE
jgi:SagB-type dehydrogenase family enzyme